MSYSFEHAKAKLDNIDLPIYLPIALSHEVMPEIQATSRISLAPLEWPLTPYALTYALCLELGLLSFRVQFEQHSMLLARSSRSSLASTSLSRRSSDCSRRMP